MTESEFFVPDLCRVRAVFLLLVTSELLVLVLAIVQAERGWIDWNYFGLLSLFVQWTTLTSAALICLLRTRLARMSVSGATTTIVAMQTASCTPRTAWLSGRAWPRRCCWRC